jgi:hypothetical protein
MIGDAGEKLHVKLLDEQRERAKEWEANTDILIADAVSKEALQMAAVAGALNDEESIRALLDQVQRKYESEDQKKMLRTSYVMRTSIDMLRNAMIPTVLRRSGTSKDPSGKSVLELRPYKVVTAWSPVSALEQEGLNRVNDVQLEHQKLRSR